MRPIVGEDHVITEWQHSLIPEYQIHGEHASELLDPKLELHREWRRKLFEKTDHFGAGTYPIPTDLSDHQSSPTKQIQ